MSQHQRIPEFRFYYFTDRYEETVSFYRNVLELEIKNSWDRPDGDKGTIFYSPNKTALIEIEEGEQFNIRQGGLYIEVENVDQWYEKLLAKKVLVNDPPGDKSYRHRSFKFEDPNGLTIALFKYLE